MKLPAQLEKVIASAALSLAWMVIAMGCRPHGCTNSSHYRIDIFNQSDTPVVFLIPDIVDTVYRLNGEPPSIDLIAPHDRYRYNSRDCYENIYTYNYSDYILFFNADTVNAIGWRGINGTNRGLLKRVRLDSTYLVQSDYSVTYP